MRVTRIAIAALVAVAGIEAQSTLPFRGDAGQIPNMSRIPSFVFGSPSAGIGVGGFGVRNRAGIGSMNGMNSGIYNGSYYGSTNSLSTSGYLLSPGFGGLNGYYYWNPSMNNRATPQGPSYENPGAVRAIGEIPPALQAPTKPSGATGNEADWADARLSFAGASAKVSAARLAVEELRARLEAIGQSPRANLTSNTAAAEAALQSAQAAMAAGNLEESAREIQRSNYLAAQVLKEFGR
jgi:hypothetical protein